MKLIEMNPGEARDLLSKMVAKHDDEKNFIREPSGKFRKKKQTAFDFRSVNTNTPPTT